MADFDLQRVLEQIDRKAGEARDATIRLTSRFDSFEARHSDHERRIGELEASVENLEVDKASTERVEQFRSEAMHTRRWLAGIAATLLCGCVGTLILLALHVGSVRGW